MDTKNVIYYSKAYMIYVSPKEEIGHLSFVIRFRVGTFISICVVSDDGTTYMPRGYIYVRNRIKSDDLISLLQRSKRNTNLMRTCFEYR